MIYTAAYLPGSAHRTLGRAGGVYERIGIL